MLVLRTVWLITAIAITGTMGFGLTQALGLSGFVPALIVTLLCGGALLAFAALSAAVITGDEE